MLLGSTKIPVYFSITTVKPFSETTSPKEGFFIDILSDSFFKRLGTTRKEMILALESKQKALS